MRTLIALSLFVSTALAATHVNISIAQHPATNPADVTYVEGMAPAELRAGPERSAKLRSGEQSVNADEQKMTKSAQQQNEDKGMGMHALQGHEGSAVRVQQGSNGHQSGAAFRQVQSFGGRSYHSGGQQGQFRQSNKQDLQNQEFERYIQNYHSGPTVETVYESASPSPQHYTSLSSSASSSSSSSSSSAGPQRVVTIAARPAQKHTFERLVASPAPAADSSPAQLSSDKNAQNAAAVAATAATVSSSSSSSAAYEQTKVAVPSYDQGNSYSRPSFEHTNYNYNDADQSAYGHEYPPSVDESQDGYAGYYGGHDQSNYYGGQGSYTPHNGYLPAPNVYQRPVVTKTIQIAQPALKAKKFEVRHPAIQKEFYDIEERVLIKPAGTIVVELEHPVAKIPRGETILPLGHPHPAIAGEYENMGQAAINTESSSTGTYNSHAGKASHPDSHPASHPTSHSASHPASHPASPSESHVPQLQPHDDSKLDFSPPKNYAARLGLNRDGIRPVAGPNPEDPPVHVEANSPPKHYAARLGLNHDGQRSNVVGSTVTSTPTHDHQIKSDFVEANLKKQYGDEVRFVAAPENHFNTEKQLFTPANSQGHQRQMVDIKYVSPGMISRDEVDFKRPAQTQNAAQAPARYTNEERRSYNFNAPQQQQQSAYTSNDDEYQAEVVPSNNFYSSPESKPARLEVRPTADDNAPRTQIIKHEHNIHLPPTQHNIYLGRVERLPIPQQRPQQNYQHPAGYNGEAGQVKEVRSYLQQHRGPTVMYAPSNQQSSHTSQRYSEPESRNQQGFSSQRSYGQLRYDADKGNNLEYSAPYSQMRFVPEESARFTAENMPSGHERTVTVNNHRGAPQYNAKLIAQESKETKENNKENMKTQSQSEMRPHTHIQIQVPNQANEAGMPIMVSSTISPPMDESHHSSANLRQQSFNSPLSSRGNNEIEILNTDASVRGDQDQYGAERAGNLRSEADCDQAKLNSRYEDQPQTYSHLSSRQQKFLRIVEAPNASAKDAPATPAPVTNIQPDNVDVNHKSTNGHVATGSRVIAATPAPTDASAASESFHKRRIVVNHPFQTVREVVEHEPITNYHQIQVNEPASPALYRQAYYQPSGAIRQVPVVFQTSPVTHGHLHYALPEAIPVHERQEREARAN